MNRGRLRRVARQLIEALWYWLPPLLLMAAIFYVSSQSRLPQAPGPHVDDVLKKLAHVTEYTLLYLLLMRALHRTVAPGRAPCMALLMTGLYGLSDELHQSFVPGRHANWYDVVIDVAVPLLLTGLWLLARRHRLLRPKNQDLAK